MVALIDRVRSKESLRSGSLTGFLWNGSSVVNQSISMSGTLNLLGYRKTIVDKISVMPARVRPPRANKLVKSFAKPPIKKKGAKWVQKSPRPRSLYELYNKPVYKRPPKKERKIYECKSVHIQSYRGYCFSGNLDTRQAPPQLAVYYKLKGQFAAAALSDPQSHYTLTGADWTDHTRATSYDLNYVNWCLEHAWNEISKPDGEVGVALGELPQLIALIASPFKAIYKTANVLRRWWRSDSWVFDPEKGLRSLRTRRTLSPEEVTTQFLDECSSRWLEIQYGLLPTISDVQCILDAIQGTLAPLREVMYGKSRFVAEKKRKAYRSRVPMGIPSFYVEYKAERVRTVVYTSKMYYRYKNLPVLSQRLGLSSSDFLGLLWELTPWSFVLDWLWDVGGYLNRISHADNVSILGNYVSIKIEEKSSYSIIGCDWYGRKQKVPNSTMYQHGEELIRLANQPGASLPQFNVKWFNVVRSLNAISLLWQKMPK